MDISVTHLLYIVIGMIIDMPQKQYKGYPQMPLKNYKNHP
jgi:hypothetical protein